MTASLLKIFFAALSKLVIVTNINRLICEIYVISKKTWMIGHKLITPIIWLLQKTHSNLWGPNDPASIRGNCYFIVIIDDNTKKV